MTDQGEPKKVGFESMVDVQDAAGGDVYSKDYWDNVFEQVGRRPLVKFALAVLAILYGSAIYAPFIANDRPYYLEGENTKGYEKNTKIVYGATSQVRELLRKTKAEFEEAAKEKETGFKVWEDAIENETTALYDRLDSMRESLPDEDHATLNEFQGQVEEAVSLAIAGDKDAAVELIGKARDQAKVIRTEYAPIDPENPDAGGKKLKPLASWPIFESTIWLEIFFSWLWLLVLTWPLWNLVIVNKLWLKRDKERIRKARRWKAAFVFGSSTIAAALWALTVGGQMAFENATYKDALTSGDFVPTKVVFAPIALGFAEQSLAEGFRPPTWTKASEITEDGFYVVGPRSVRVDPATLMDKVGKPVTVKYGEPERNSGWRHMLGTDFGGRDLLVRILYGGRISLAVGILSTVLLVFIGVVIGSIAGYFGGWVDILISRMIEIFQAFPAFFLILTAVTMIPDDKIHPIFAIVFFIAVVRWTGVARLVRGEFLRLKDAEFVIAAQALGFSNARVIFRHVLPNALGPVLVAAAFSIAAGILTESGISFLGLGIKIPIPSWGSLLNEAKGSGEQWWLQIFPGILIFVTVFCYNIVGEGVRDALDPRRKV